MLIQSKVYEVLSACCASAWFEFQTSTIIQSQGHNVISNTDTVKWPLSSRCSYLTEVIAWLRHGINKTYFIHGSMSLQSQACQTGTRANRKVQEFPLLMHCPVKAYGGSGYKYPCIINNETIWKQIQIPTALILRKIPICSVHRTMDGTQVRVIN
jgi:hypothetical protein